MNESHRTQRILPTPSTTLQNRADQRRNRADWIDQIPRRVDLTVTAERTLNEALDLKGIHGSLRSTLGTHDRIVEKSLTIRMDDDSTRTFVAYRAQHSAVLGPYKGGLRLQADLEVGTLAELASLMTWKAAVADLPFGGAKGGIRADATQLSRAEKRRLIEAYVEAFRELLGPETDIMAPDLNTDPETMRWIVDAWARSESHDPAIVTGKPVDVGGLRLRDRSTGLGILVMTQRALAEEGRSLSGATVAIQGFGNVGHRVAQLFSAAGAKIVAVSDVSGGVRNELGIDIAALSEHVRRTGQVRGFQATEITNDELICLPVDILVPAAVGGVITAGNADRVRASLVVEGANGPISGMADLILNRRGVRIVPDVLANCGGIVGSYIEWQQNLQQESWRDDQVLQAFLERLHDTYSQAQQARDAHGVSLRLACYLVAVGRVVEQLSTERAAHPAQPALEWAI